MAEGDANATEPHPEKRLGVTADVQDAETLICPMKAALLKWALGRIKMRASATTTWSAIKETRRRGQQKLLATCATRQFRLDSNV